MGGFTCIFCIICIVKFVFPVTYWLIIDIRELCYRYIWKSKFISKIFRHTPSMWQHFIVQSAYRQCDSYSILSTVKSRFIVCVLHSMPTWQAHLKALPRHHANERQPTPAWCQCSGNGSHSHCRQLQRDGVGQGSTRMHWTSSGCVRWDYKGPVISLVFFFWTITSGRLASPAGGVLHPLLSSGHGSYWQCTS